MSTSRDRHDQLLGGGQGVDRQEAERGRAVEEDEVVAAFTDGGERLLEARFPGELADKLDLRSRQIDRGGDRVQILHGGRDDGALDRRLRQDDVIHGDTARLVTDPHAGRRVALRVQVDDQDPVAELGESRSETDRRG